MTVFKTPFVRLMNTYCADKEQRVADQYKIDLLGFLAHPTYHIAYNRAWQLRRFFSYTARVWFYYKDQFPEPQFEKINGVLLPKEGTASAFIIDCLDAAGLRYPAGHIDQFYRSEHESLQRILAEMAQEPRLQDELDRKRRGAFKFNPW